MDTAYKQTESDNREIDRGTERLKEIEKERARATGYTDDFVCEAG